MKKLGSVVTVVSDMNTSEMALSAEPTKTTTHSIDIGWMEGCVATHRNGRDLQTDMFKA